MSPLAIPAVCLALVLGYGWWRIPRVTMGPSVRVALVQGNIPQEEKWDEAYQQQILQRYAALTHAAAATRPDLIVWPETSVPGYLGLEEPLTQEVVTIARATPSPLLVGAPRTQLTNERGLAWTLGETVMWRTTNAAALLNTDGTILQWHEKLHLVPFGEFIPGERYAPWLRHVLPPIGDFAPGRAYTVFTVPLSDINPQSTIRNPQFQFSVLICFEDLFPEMGRRFVRDGAQVLLVITNDAWFGPTAAAYQHAQASIFRAVELRVPVLRAANTGWSGGVDPVGRIIGSVRDAAGQELFVEGTQTCEAALGPAQSGYKRWGDWFAVLCVFGSVGALWSTPRRRRRVAST